MVHRIVVLSDGTGNSAAKVWRTNVWRVFEFLDLTGSEQVAKYDDGVGSSAFLPLALLGGACGWGLKRNVIDLYKFVCRNYRHPSANDPSQPGSQIHAFGFSRGAFTVRVLIGLILREGLVPYHSESDLHARATAAYRALRAERFHSVLRIEWIFRKIRDAIISVRNRLTDRKDYDKQENTVVPSIEFIGVWDTVAAYGLPIEEMTRGVSQWIWPLELPTRTLDCRIRRACHALALDDERTTFHPVLWNEKGEQPPAARQDGHRWLQDERISQVWFTGVHSNVGGGYPDDALAYIPLYWMMEEAKARGLVFKAPPGDPDAFRRAASARDKDGRQYDSRAGIAGYYRYGPRKIADLSHMRLSRNEGDSVDIDLPKIHESVLSRLRSDSNAYAPIGLPANYAVATFDGRIVRDVENTYETAAEASARADEQEKVWNLVWLRRIVYFATLAASFHLAAFWLFHDLTPEREFESPIRLVSEVVRLIESFLPRQVVRWWTDYYAANPISFSIGVIAVAVLIWLGAKLAGCITDSMRIIWRSRPTQSTLRDAKLHNAIYLVRSSWPYQMVLWIGKRHVLPFLSAVFLLWLGVGAASHFLFNVVDSTGVFCRGTDTAQLERLTRGGDRSAKKIVFPTDALCFATGVYLERGARYSVSFVQDTPWADNSRQQANPIHPSGFTISDLSDWQMKLRNYAALPFRRVMFRRWFDVVARVGPSGIYEDFLDPARIAGNTYRGSTATIKRDGELFLYVNDGVIALPWLTDVFYRNNHGTAHIEVSRLNHCCG
jgi:Uncharacterized alpha/beta hydrolase domain (DUF2235)